MGGGWERESTYAPLSEVFSAGDSSITHRKRPLILVDNIKSPRRQLTSLLVVKVGVMECGQNHTRKQLIHKLASMATGDHTGPPVLDRPSERVSVAVTMWNYMITSDDHSDTARPTLTEDKQISSHISYRTHSATLPSQNKS